MVILFEYGEIMMANLVKFNESVFKFRHLSQINEGIVGNFAQGFGNTMKGAWNVVKPGGHLDKFADGPTGQKIGQSVKSVGNKIGNTFSSLSSRLGDKSKELAGLPSLAGMVAKQASQVVKDPYGHLSINQPQKQDSSIYKPTVGTTGKGAGAATMFGKIPKVIGGVNKLRNMTGQQPLKAAPQKPNASDWLAKKLNGGNFFNRPQ